MSFQNDATMKEKADALRNDQRLRDQASTLHQFAEADASTSLGRFSAISSPDVIGSEPSPATRYPAGAAWTRDDQGLEPSIGYAINELVGDSPLRFLRVGRSGGFDGRN